MRPGEGPVFTEPLKNPADMERLKDIDVNENLKYVMDAISTTRRALEGKVSRQQLPGDLIYELKKSNMPISYPVGNMDF